MPEKEVSDVGAFDTPWTWYVCFHMTCRTSALSRLIPDRFKHVSAVGYSSRTRTWIFYDPAFGRTRIFTALDDTEGHAILAHWFSGATVVEMNVPQDRRRTWRPGGWCVTMIAHLLAIRSRAVLPSGLLRDCLTSGGRIIHDVLEQA